MSETAASKISAEDSRPRLQLGRSSASTNSNRCPKCSAVRWKAAATCQQCGLVFQKWTESQARKATTESDAIKRQRAERSDRQRPHGSRVRLSLARPALHALTFGMGALVMLGTINGTRGSSFLDLDVLRARGADPVVEIQGAEDGAPAGLKVPAGHLPGTRDLAFQLVSFQSSADPDGGELAHLVFRNLTGTTIRDLKVQGVGEDFRDHAIYTDAVRVEQLFGPGKTLEATLEVPLGVELEAFRIGHWRQDLGRVALQATTHPTSNETAAPPAKIPAG